MAAIVLRTLIERRERHAALRGQRQQALPPVGRRRRLGDEAALVEAVQDAAEVTDIVKELVDLVK